MKRKDLCVKDSGPGKDMTTAAIFTRQILPNSAAQFAKFREIPQIPYIPWPVGIVVLTDNTLE